MIIARRDGLSYKKEYICAYVNPYGCHRIKTQNNAVLLPATITAVSSSFVFSVVFRFSVKFFGCYNAVKSVVLGIN